MNELDLQRDCNYYLRMRNILFYHKEKGRHAKQKEHQAGLPDLCIWYKGKAIFIELKGSTGKMKSAQVEWNDRAVRSGFKYYIVRTFDEFKTIMTLEYDS